MSIQLEDYGEYLGIRDQNFIVFHDGEESQAIPFHKAKRAVISSGNSVSTSALFWLAQYGVETLIVSKANRVVSVLVPCESDMRANTRMMQYEAYHSEKGVMIANSFVRARIQAEITLSERYDFAGIQGLERQLSKLDIQGENVEEVRNKIQRVEAGATRIYLREYFKQFPEGLRPKKRSKYGARDPLNNLLNLGYEVVKREIILALLPMHLDPYLGFLHSYFRYKQSLVYDLIEPFRAVVEEFVLTYHDMLSKDSFEKHGDRTFLKKKEEIAFIQAVHKKLEKRTPYQRYGKPTKARIKTIIKEEPIKLAQYIRNKHPEYKPALATAASSNRNP